MVQRADAAGQHGLRVLEVSVLPPNTNAGVFFLPVTAGTRKGWILRANLSNQPAAQFLSLVCDLLERAISKLPREKINDKKLDKSEI